MPGPTKAERNNLQRQLEDPNTVKNQSEIDNTNDPTDNALEADADARKDAAFVV